MVEIKCIVNGKDISDKVKDYLVTMVIVDNDGTDADTLDMTLSNYIKRPEGQDEIKLWINTHFYGIYTVNETQTNDENLLNVSATSANFHKTLKTKQNKSYGETTLHALINKVAEKHKLKTKIDFEDIAYENIVQEKESDLHFLKRMADKYDAIFSIKNEVLIFRKRDAEFPEFTIDINDCKPWSIKHIARKKYNSCTASWRSTKENKTLSTSAGSGEPVLKVTGDYLSDTDAQLVAKGALAKSKRQTKEGTFSKTGEYLSAGSTLLVIGSKQDNGKYTIRTVTTTVDRDIGFRVDVEFEN